VVNDVINNRWAILFKVLIHVGQEIVPVKIGFGPFFVIPSMVLLLDRLSSKEKVRAIRRIFHGSADGCLKHMAVSRLTGLACDAVSILVGTS
jgi:hypothetical protein